MKFLGKAPCKGNVCYPDISQFLLQLQKPPMTPFPLLSDVGSGVYFIVDVDYFMEEELFNSICASATSGNK